MVVEIMIVTYYVIAVPLAIWVLRWSTGQWTSCWAYWSHWHCYAWFNWALTFTQWDGTSMDLFWILFGIFASAIAISLILGRIHGTLIIWWDSSRHASYSHWCCLCSPLCVLWSVHGDRVCWHVTGSGSKRACTMCTTDCKNLHAGKINGSNTTPDII